MISMFLIFMAFSVAVAVFGLAFVFAQLAKDYYRDGSKWMLFISAWASIALVLFAFAILEMGGKVIS